LLVTAELSDLIYDLVLDAKNLDSHEESESESESDTKECKSYLNWHGSLQSLRVTTIAGCLRQCALGLAGPRTSQAPRQGRDARHQCQAGLRMRATAHE